MKRFAPLFSVAAATVLSSACADMTPVTTVEESPALSTLKQLGAATLSPMSDADEQAFGRLATDSQDTVAMLAELEAGGYRFAPPLGYWTDGEAGSLATVAYFGSNGHETGTVVAFFDEAGQPVSTIAFEADGDRGLIAREMGPSGLVLLPELPGTAPFPAASAFGTNEAALTGGMSGPTSDLCKIQNGLIDAGAGSADGLCEIKAAFECGVPYMFDAGTRNRCWTRVVDTCAIKSSNWKPEACH